MINYNYVESQSLEEINALGAEDWEVVSITINDSPQSFDAFIKKGRQGYNLIEADSSSNFYIDNSFSLGDSIVMIFLTIFLFGIVSALIYNFIWKNG